MSSYPNDYITSQDVNVESGVIPLGPSKNSPIALATVQNYNNRSWFTLENTLPLPVLVSGVQQGSGIQTNVGSGLTVPPFARCTLPVSPTSDVMLSCLGSGQLFDMATWDGATIFSNLPKGTFKQRNLQYMLHDNGSMYQSDIITSPLQMGGGFENIGANGIGFVWYVAPSLSEYSANVSWIWTGGPLGQHQISPDAFLTHFFISVEDFGPAADPGNITLRACYDFDSTVPRHTSFSQGIQPFAGQAIGSVGYSAIVKCPGAIGFSLQNFDTATLLVSFAAWGMVPAQ